MPSSAVRIAFALAIAGSIYPCICQVHQIASDPPQGRPVSAAYEWFFDQVMEIRSTPEPGSEAAPSVAGNRALAVSRIQEAIGLSQPEAEIVYAAAADCVSGINALQEEVRALIFESRMEFIESGKHPEALTEKINSADTRRIALVTNRVQRLKSALSESASAKLDAYIRAPFDPKKNLMPFSGLKPSVVEVRKKDPPAAPYN